MTHHDDFHKEPVPGLPAHLPEGEAIIWQGKPERSVISRNALHNRKIGLYFVALASWKLVSGISDGKAFSDLAFSVGGTVILGALALLILFGIAALITKTTVYTITNKRVVMRFGIALPITFQFPFTQITSADVKHLGGTHGTVVFSLKEHTKISWLVLWPHVRGWKMGKPQPALRAIADVDSVADIFAKELRSAHQYPAEAVASRSGVREISQQNAPSALGTLKLSGATTRTA